jgi:hypothetical protein
LTPRCIYCASFAAATSFRAASYPHINRPGIPITISPIKSTKACLPGQAHQFPHLGLHLSLLSPRQVIPKYDPYPVPLPAGADMVTTGLVGSSLGVDTRWPQGGRLTQSSIPGGVGPRSSPPRFCAAGLRRAASHPLKLRTLQGWLRLRCKLGSTSVVKDTGPAPYVMAWAGVATGGTLWPSSPTP